MSHEETRAFATHYFLLKLKSNSICEWQVMLERLFSVKFNERVRVSHFFRANATTSSTENCLFFFSRFRTTENFTYRFSCDEKVPWHQGDHAK